LPAATPTGVPAATGGAPDGVLSPKALLAVAAELKGRRELVERRERELETREAALDLVEERLAAQIDRLEGLKRDLEGVLGQISADEQARLDQLAKVYEAMKAKKAASILDAMALDLLLPVVRRMRDTKVAAVIAEMDPAKARLLTAELAKAKTLPSLPPPARSAEPLPLARLGTPCPSSRPVQGHTARGGREPPGDLEELACRSAADRSCTAAEGDGHAARLLARRLRRSHRPLRGLPQPSAGVRRTEFGLGARRIGSGCRRGWRARPPGRAAPGTARRWSRPGTGSCSARPARRMKESPSLGWYSACVSETV
jgi:flagellar motility protein MotE (MotC chaperone)